jgi:hypothetical protein
MRLLRKHDFAEEYFDDVGGLLLSQRGASPPADPWPCSPLAAAQPR